MKLRTIVALVLGLVWLNVGMAEGLSTEAVQTVSAVAHTPLNPAHHPHHPWNPHNPWNPHYPHYPQYPHYGYGYGTLCSTWGGVCPIAPGPVGVSCWCAFWNGTFWGNVIR